MNKFDIDSEVVIMCGISGSGKSRFARLLENEGYKRLSTDVLIWDKTGAGLFSLPINEQKKIFAECRLKINNLLIDCLKSGKKVVVDATHCKRSARDEIRNICEKFQLSPKFVYCYAEKEELWNRLSKRKGTGPDDLIVTYESLTEYWEDFERPQEDETDFIFLDQK